jgi:hypothetical protein
MAVIFLIASMKPSGTWAVISTARKVDGMSLSPVMKIFLIF